MDDDDPGEVKPPYLPKRIKHNLPLTPDQHRLATENVSLVFHAMKQLTTSNLDSDARLSACGIALIYAARTFDPAKGKFSSHYFHWAKSFISSDSWNTIVRVPRYLKIEAMVRHSLDNIGKESKVESVAASEYSGMLTEKQADVIHRIYDLNQSISRIAKELGVKNITIISIHKASLLTLKRKLE